MNIFLLIIVGVVLVIAILSCYIFFTVAQQTMMVVERFGKFKRIAPPGLNTKIPFVEKVKGKVSLRIQQLNVPAETKTSDNVFVKVAVSVQYYVMDKKIYEAFYKLSNPEDQITAFVFDVVRARVPKIKLDDVFEKKDEVATAVREELSELMEDFGYGILKALVTDIDPDAKVKAAMNEINEAQRLRVAANERGEAEKILKVKQAEAEALSKALQGKGIADQRKAIINGLGESVEEFKKSIPESHAEDVMNVVLITQYFDTLKEIGALSKTNTILLPHSATSLHDIAAHLRESIISSNLATAKE